MTDDGDMTDDDMTYDDFDPPSPDEIQANMLAAEIMAAEAGMAYCKTPPTDTELGAGLIATHNLPWTGQEFAENGWRSWVEAAANAATERREPCPCEWGRPGLTNHYRTRRAP
jgi:hypothetical protein